jgi:predicted dehydrogenase
VYSRAVTHIPERVDERGERYAATADDAAYGIFELEGGPIVQLNSSWTVRVNREELVEFQVDGTLGSAVVGLFGCKIQPRNATPKPVWNPDLRETHDYSADWIEVPDNEPAENGFKVQWEQFLRHVLEDAPYSYNLLAGARGVRLSEAGLRSSTEGRRIELAPVSL